MWAPAPTQPSVDRPTPVCFTGADRRQKAAGRVTGLRDQAAELQARLNHLERHDWPRWLCEADTVTRDISELLRRAAEDETAERRRPGQPEFSTARYVDGSA